MLAPAIFKRAAGAAAMVATLGLAGCGGGAYVDVGGGPSVGPPPTITLAITVPSPALPGDAVTLLADPQASNGIDYVNFYRIDPGNVVTLLGTVGQPPARWDTSIPVNAPLGSTIGFYASVHDLAGLATSSNVIYVTVGQ